jgi:hypothetical protein
VLGLHTVGLLGTLPVMRSGELQRRYRDRFEVSILVPNDSDMAIVDRIILDELVRRGLRPDGVKHGGSAAARSQERVAELAEPQPEEKRHWAKSDSFLPIAKDSQSMAAFANRLAHSANATRRPPQSNGVNDDSEVKSYERKTQQQCRVCRTCSPESAKPAGSVESSVRLYCLWIWQFGFRGGAPARGEPRSQRSPA